MKKLILLLLTGGMVWACSDANKEAMKLLAQAQVMVSNDSLASAKRMIDSARNAYPKAFDAIKQGKQLMRHIERTEFERTLAYCDSMLPIKIAELEPLKKGFVFEKDSQYQESGNYVSKLQQIERNVERCYLRSQVDENGKLVLASVYFGKSKIEHSAMRLELNDGQFAETQSIPYDGGNNYRFEDNGNWSEIVSYKDGKDNGTIALICNNPKERIKVKLMGKKPYIFYLDDLTKKAISATADLAIVLSDIDRLKKEQARASKGIEILSARIAEKSAEQQESE